MWRSLSALAKTAGRGVSKLERRRWRRATGRRRQDPRSAGMSGGLLAEAADLLVASVPHRDGGRNVDPRRFGYDLGRGLRQIRLRFKRRDEGALALRHRAF